MVKNANTYYLYGLTVATPFPCPELLPSSKAPDVIVRFENNNDSAITWSEEGVCYKATLGRYVLNVKGTANYLLSDGKQISIEKDPDADEDALRLFFYNEVAVALLMQRGMLVLKGSVVARDGKAFVLLGRTSAGKSITAAGLSRNGFSVVSDNICAIDTINGEVLVSAGSPYLLLWERGMRELNITPDDYKPVRRGMNKFYVPVKQNSINEMLPVAGIWLLSEHNEKNVSSYGIQGADKLFVTLNSRYHSRSRLHIGKSNELAAITAKQVNMRRIESNMSADLLGDYIGFLGKELGK